MAFETMTLDELAGAHGGVQMKLTQYGYANDPYMDSYTAKGLGAYRNLDKQKSMAITDSGLAALGLSRTDVRRHEHWVELRLKGGGTLERRIDDRAPQKEMRADLYMPGGFDRGLPDYADVRLRR
ncbi:MAG TPA: hypothetical protein VIV11_36020 [Kofleriaceae bacterium]